MTSSSALYDCGNPIYLILSLRKEIKAGPSWSPTHLVVLPSQSLFEKHSPCLKTLQACICLLVVISGIRALKFHSIYKTCFICVMYLSHSVFFHPEKKLPASLQHRSHNLHGRSRRLAEHPGEHGVTPARSVNKQQGVNVGERAHRQLPPSGLDGPGSPQQASSGCTPQSWGRATNQPQPSLNHIKALKPTSDAGQIKPSSCTVCRKNYRFCAECF